MFASHYSSFLFLQYCPILVLVLVLTPEPVEGLLVTRVLYYSLAREYGTVRYRTDHFLFYRKDKIKNIYVRTVP